MTNYQLFNVNTPLHAAKPWYQDNVLQMSNVGVSFCEKFNASRQLKEVNILGDISQVETDHNTSSVTQFLMDLAAEAKKHRCFLSRLNFTSGNRNRSRQIGAKL